MIREGDVVEIPLPSGRMAVGWILHISQLFRDAVGFIVFGIKGQLGNANSDRSRSLQVRGPLYANIDAINHYGWKTIAHQPVSESRRLLTKRRIGGDVYVGDCRLGPVSHVRHRQRNWRDGGRTWPPTVLQSPLAKPRGEWSHAGSKRWRSSARSCGRSLRLPRSGSSS